MITVSNEESHIQELPLKSKYTVQYCLPGHAHLENLGIFHVQNMNGQIKITLTPIIFP